MEEHPTSQDSIALVTVDLDNCLWETDAVIINAERISFEVLVHQIPEIAELFTIETLREYKQDLASCFPAMAHQVSKLRFETLRRACLQAGYTGDHARLAAQTAFDAFYRERSNISLFDGALDALKELANDFHLIALTNGNADLEQIGIRQLFDHHICAEEAGAAKPDPLIFDTALGRYGLKPHQAIHIGDHPHQDIEGARSHGMHTIWVNVLNLEWPSELAPANHQISHLAQLPDTVRAIAAG